MNLLQVRQWFVEESGRYDLVVDTVAWADNGADRVIQAAQKLLDDILGDAAGPAHNMQKLESGTYHLVFGSCRAILEVWCIDQTDDSRYQLTLDTSIQTECPPVTTGPPLYYLPYNFRLAPEKEMAVEILDIPAKYLGVLGSGHLYNGIVVNPVADADYIIEVIGHFYSSPLEDDADTDYWSYRYPHVLVMAAQCILEMFARNTEGVKDWMFSINQILGGIQRNQADEESYNISQMDG